MNYMATKIDEQRMVVGNAVAYESRIHSPLNRFTDKTFTPTRYWHIEGNKSFVDNGLGDVEQVIGPNSPIRYRMIENFPLCGIEPIAPQIQNNENVLDTTFEGEATTYNGTLKPLENDFFMITYLSDPWIFRVTAVEYDNLVSSNKYKIQYTLEYIDSVKVAELMRQTLSTHKCLIENIGTDLRCIIETGEMDRIKKIEDMYDQMMDTYITFFYNARYNCFLGDFGDGRRLYDPLQEMFVSKHQLFTRKTQIDGLVFIEQFNDPRREWKYQKSIYRFMELRRMDYLTRFPYTVFDGRINPQTAFHRWLDPGVVILDIPRTTDTFDHVTSYNIFSDEVVDAIKTNTALPTIHGELIRRFVRCEHLTLDDIDLNLHDAILKINDSDLEVFFITPLILYIIRTIVDSEMKKERETDEISFFE